MNPEPIIAETLEPIAAARQDVEGGPIIAGTGQVMLCKRLGPTMQLHHSGVTREADNLSRSPIPHPSLVKLEVAEGRLVIVSDATITR